MTPQMPLKMPNKILAVSCHFFFWVILSSLPTVKLAAKETVTQFFVRAEEAYKKLQDYRAVWYMNINGQDSVATVYYKTPGHIYLDYSKPSKHSIHITEEQLVIYNRKNNILMIQPLKGAVGGPPSLRVMRRLYSMRYKHSSGSQAIVAEGIDSPVIVLLLNPINSAARLKELEVSFYADTLLLRQVKGFWYGSQVEYNFLEIQTNIGLDEAIFKLQKHSGAKEWHNFLQD